ncbi:hypothetical protein CDFC105_70419 [Clostridioides difficile]|nr:hypothetical protein CDFC105_62202 [Clostridioides difficile]CZS00823.1 hypothetical protein CDFC105_70419 [Clostridioides difficile]
MRLIYSENKYMDLNLEIFYKLMVVIYELIPTNVVLKVL